jgi:acyl-CoA synthetase (NDP forming)
MGTERFRALFEPRGVLVAGASTHPGKFGFVSLHNILACGYEGKVFATNRDGVEVLGVQSVTDVDQLPDGEIDLVFVCTPAGANPDLLRACAKKGITAAFIASAGYGEAGEDGRRAQDELVALADELGILLAGPNGQGVVSPPAKLCAQIVAPYPPVGHIGIASQSGNFVSSFENYAQLSGVGVSRAVSAGNAAAVTVPDYLEYYADDPETRVSLAYVASATGGRSSSGCGPSPSASRSCWSRAAPRPAGSGPRPATPALWRPTTPCSTGCAGRRASPGCPRSSRPTRWRRRSPPSPCRPATGSPS